MLVDLLIEVFGSYSILISFFGGFLAGAETIFALSVLSAQGIMPVWVVFVFCGLGMFTSDFMWFMFGKLKFLSKLKKIPYVHFSYKKAAKIINKIQSPFVLLVMAKFAYFAGVPLLAYLGRKRIKLGRFLLYNFLIIFSWVFFITLFGWFAGRGFELFYKTYNSIELGLLIVVIGFVIIYVVKNLLKDFFSEKK